MLGFHKSLGKRKRANSPDLEERPTKRNPFSKLRFPSPIAQRDIRKRIPVESGRHMLEKIRDKSDADRRHKWMSDFMPPPAGCSCHAPSLEFCICEDMREPLPCFFNKLPAEIMQHIFDIMIPPENLLDSSLHCGPASAWCSSMVTKRSLVLVSKYWYSNALTFLYRSIVIRRPVGLLSLLDTLTTSPRLGELVRSITLASYLSPESRDKSTVYYSMQRLLELCPNVKSVNDLPPFSLPVRYTFPALPSTVTFVKISPFDHPDDILEILQLTCGQLEELSLCATDHTRVDAKTLVFPRLSSLCLTIGGSINEPKPALRTFALKWRMPQLKALTFRSVAEIEHLSLSADYRHILAKHGKLLEYLAFPNVFPQTLNEKGMEDFGPLLKLCPAVKHLVLPAYASVSAADADAREAVKWLDHWCFPDYTAPKDRQHVLRGFSSLKGYRLLDTALGVVIPDLPRTFDPRIRDAWTLSFPGLVIAQEVDAESVPHLMLGDLAAVEDWEGSFFGAMEAHTVQREQEYFDLGVGQLVHVPFLPPMPPSYHYPWREMDGDRDVYDNIAAPYNLQWASDETDDEESDLEEEDVEDLDDEFYLEREGPDPLLPQWAHPPASISQRASFPWLSSALQNSLFAPLIS
ncbi:hypothetical protein B0H19DRAFT_1377198 [Mycena capillaripes]|nr:hypothetical protein B0H19DRAFT_1377198 [Mycena capillaripes]